MGRGRPRKTDPDEALRTAMRLFWEQGFEATSMNDIAAATGMAKPGLYATFGDKEALYARALERYVAEVGVPMLDELVHSPGPLKAVIRRLLAGVVKSVTDKATPEGCFLANCIVENSGHASTREALTRSYNAAREKAFVDRFRRAQDDGELPPDCDPRALGEFFSGQAVALAVLGRGGASRKALERFVDVAMTALPDGGTRH